MVSVLTYDKNEKELEQLQILIKDLAAYLSEEEWKMHKTSILEQLEVLLQEKPLLDMLLYDVTNPQAMGYLAELRKDYRETQLMLIADMTTSPMEYMKPGILASSLLLRPWRTEQAREVLEEFFRAYLEKHQCAEDKNAYVIESKEGMVHIPYEQIYYFEAREKKIYLCTGKEEYGFYHTIDKLAEELPSQFVRCHRSFIVNQYKIRKVALSQSLIFLTDGFDVPLSRSYKPLLKGLAK